MSIIIITDIPITNVTGDGELIKKLQAGESVNISCTSVGAPVPTIRWTFNGVNITHFDQTETNYTDYVFTEVITGPSTRASTITPGSSMSTLHILNFQSENEGIYECIGSNIGTSVTLSDSALVSVLFLS